MAVKQCGGCGVAITDRLGYGKKLCPVCITKCAEADRQRRVKKWQEAMKVKYKNIYKLGRYEYKEFNKERPCAKCKESPKKPNSHYCEECHQRYHYAATREWRAKYGKRVIRSDGICPRCKVNKKDYSEKQKRLFPYCNVCRVEKGREHRANKRLTNAKSAV